MTARSIFIASLIVLPTAAAQHLPEDRERPAQTFEERLSAEIDRFLTRITDSLIDDTDGSAFPADTIDRKPRRSLRTADLETESYAHSFSGNTTVDEDETLRGDVVVKGGHLTVRGTIDGDVLMIGGNVYVRRNGRITGDVRAINGDIVAEDGGIIEGYQDKSSQSAGYREDRSRFRRHGTSFDVPWKSELSTIENLLVRYNRVEGLFIGLGSEKRYYWDGRRSWAAFGTVGWGFKSHTWRYNLGLARQFPLTVEGNHLLEFGVEGYSLTDSKDSWIIGTNENSTAAFFIHEDFHDFFGRRGVTAHTAWLTQGPVLRTELRVGYAADTYRSLEQRTDWALFGGKKRFRPNPAIPEGEMRSVIVQAGLSTVDHSSFGPEGWALLVRSELGRGMTGSDFSFDQHTLDIRRYQPIGRYDNINLRMRAGSGAGLLPLQKMFEIGGLSTLHAYRYKSFAGNRMLLMNAEYIVNGRFLEDLDFWPASILGGLNFLLMSDAGLARTASPEASAQAGFGSIRWNEFAHNFGFGISNRKGSFRLAYTWRTDVRAPGMFTFRFVRPF